MPIYEYRCTKCEEQFELLMRASDVAECPHGCGTAVEKQLSITAAPSVSGSSLPVCGPPPPPGGG